MATPKTDASPTLPGRILYIHAPVSRAAGIVTRIVNMLHELSLSTFTTTIATLASTAITMNSAATAVVVPATGPMSVAGDFRQRLPVVPHRSREDHEIVNAPGKAGPDHNPCKTGKIAPLGGEDWPNQRAWAGNRRKMVPEENDIFGRMIIDAVPQPMGRRSAAIIQHRHLRRQKRPVEPIRHQKGRQRRNHQPERVHRGGGSAGTGGAFTFLHHKIPGVSSNRLHRRTRQGGYNGQVCDCKSVTANCKMRNEPLGNRRKLNTKHREHGGARRFKSLFPDGFHIHARISRP